MAGFNPNKFIKDSSECSDHSVNVVPVTKTSQTKRKKKTKEEETTTPVVVEAPVPQTSMSYIQNDIPYMMAYAETNQQLDSAIKELNVLGGEIMTELVNVKNSKTLKNKYNYINDMTSTLTSIINTKIGAIKEKNKSINDVNNLELRRIKDLKINNSEEDDNTKIMNLYDAFVNTPIGSGQNILGPSMSELTLSGGTNLPVIGIGNDQQAWEQQLNPTENRMLLGAKGVIETVVMYDENTGNRWYEVIDKNTKQPVPNVEKPDDSYIYDLDISIRGGYAKDSNRKVTYPLIVVNSAQAQGMSEY